MTDKPTFYHDHKTLEEFVRALARTHLYKSRDSGEVVDAYWQREAEDWVRELDAEKENVKAEVLALWQDGKVL